MFGGGRATQKQVPHHRGTWGSINRKIVEVVPDCDTMFSDIETLMDSAPGLCAQLL
jgi:hypothetical protein